MNTSKPSVFTIAPGSRFLHVLAEKILGGFPLGPKDPRPSLSDWTILLPTRRAARELATILAGRAKSKALLLPMIKPIGDLDEDLILNDYDRGDLPAALPRSGQLLILIGLLDQWATENPQITLAQEIRNSPVQSLNLAASLLKLLDQIEIEETNFDRLSEAYEADLSEHRGAILGLINLLKIDLAKKLRDENLMSQTARRCKLIRLEARRIERGEIRGPLVAAGSTGTIPATRALLKAIAYHPQGAVILPGLDQAMDDPTWSAITPEHPQYSLKLLASDLAVTRSEIQELGEKERPRNWLGSELMRPSKTADQWHNKVTGLEVKLNEALTGLRLIEAPDRHNEALTIALILRETLEHGGRTAALITPDRDLGRRVKAELRRWNILINDSAGESLAKHGLASLMIGLIAAINNGFTATSLLGLLRHTDCNFGMDRESFLKILGNLELALLRRIGHSVDLDGLKSAYEKATNDRVQKIRSHHLVAKLGDEDWSDIRSLVLQITATLKPLMSNAPAALSAHIDLLRSCIGKLAPHSDWSLPENQKLAEILYDLESQSPRHPNAPLSTVSALLGYMLYNETLRTSEANQHRISIYGVLEARLLSTDVTILGGLNEGKWPAQPDPGPWLNRTMRDIFGMQQPERDIGVSAHDFAQGFGYQKLCLTWAKRIEGAPQIPSRWILRLQTVLQAANMETETCMDRHWSGLAQRLDQSNEVSPHQKPKPKPPVSARPIHFSVSTVEKLIRDPYSVYAAKILKLDPLPPLAKSVDARLRGIVFHAAIDQWNKLKSTSPAANGLDLLLTEGRRIFETQGEDPEVMVFWWPRFSRMANWLTASEFERSKNTVHVFAEIEGRIQFDISGVTHALTARADRIDILSDGHARIIDYKSGSLPSGKQMLSGMKPQLPLEAAILAEGGFPNLDKIETDELLVLHIGGTEEEGKQVSITREAQTPTTLGLAHLASFKALLQLYRAPNQAYYPRANLFKEDEATDYDHLSRYAEWILAGE